MKVIYTILTVTGWAWTLAALIFWLVRRDWPRRPAARGFDLVQKGGTGDEQG